jgi:hypothetical protein
MYKMPETSKDYEAKDATAAYLTKGFSAQIYAQMGPSKYRSSDPLTIARGVMARAPSSDPLTIARRALAASKSSNPTIIAERAKESSKAKLSLPKEGIIDDRYDCSNKGIKKNSLYQHSLNSKNNRESPFSSRDRLAF